MTERDEYEDKNLLHLAELLRTKQRRLELLELQRARGGNSVEVAVVAEIEELQQQVAHIHARVERLKEENYVTANMAIAHQDWTRAADVLDQIFRVDRTYKDTEELLRRARQQERLAQDYAEALKAEADQKWAWVITLYKKILADDQKYKDVKRRLKHAQTQCLAAAERQQQLAEYYADARQAEGNKDWQRTITICQSIMSSDPHYRDTRRLLRKAHFHRRVKWIIIGGFAILVLVIALIVWPRPPGPVSIDAFAITRRGSTPETIRPGAMIPATVAEIFRVHVDVSALHPAPGSLFLFRWYTCKQRDKPLAQNLDKIEAPSDMLYVAPGQPGLDCVHIVVSQGDRLLGEGRIFIDIK